MVDIYNFLKSNLKIEVIYTDNLSRAIQFASKILLIHDDRIFIDDSSNLSSEFSIEARAKIKLIISTEHGTFSGYSSVISKGTLENGKNGYWITFPYNTQYCQRREYVRVPMRIDFYLSIFNGNQSKRYELQSKNISAKGLSFVTDFKIENFDKLRVEFLPSQNSKPYSFFCDLIYSNEIGYVGGKKYMNAVEFSDISQEDIAQLIKICFKFQLNQRRVEKNNL